MMVDLGPIAADRYSHDLLLHDNDDELVAGTVAFVEQALASGGQVLVHGSADRVAMMRSAIGSHPRLKYGEDDDLYQSPLSTLFAYQRTMAERREPIELWATGPVPICTGRAVHAGWARYESLVNEVLSPYAFHGLCTYDTQTLPARAIAVARATHPTLHIGRDRVSCTDYLEPTAFLSDSSAGLVDPGDVPPTATVRLDTLHDLRPARGLLSRIAAEWATEIARDTVEGFVSAAHEVLANGLEHGRPPVRLAIWAEASRLTCRITDAGPGIADTLAGYRYPEGPDHTGLWMARQLCEDIIISNPPGGGCQVIMTTVQ